MQLDFIQVGMALQFHAGSHAQCIPFVEEVFKFNFASSFDQIIVKLYFAF